MDIRRVQTDLLIEKFVSAHQWRVVNMIAIVVFIFVFAHQFDLPMHEVLEERLQGHIVLDNREGFNRRQRSGAGHLAQQIVRYCPGLDTHPR